MKVVGVLALSLILSHGCGRQPTPNPAPAQSKTLPPVVYDFVQNVHPDNPWDEQKALVGNEYRNVLFAPYATDESTVANAMGETIPLADLVDVERIHDEATAIDVYFRVRIGRESTRIALESPIDRERLSRILVRIPPRARRALARERRQGDSGSPELTTWAREVANPSYTSDFIQVPKDASLQFGFGVIAGDSEPDASAIQFSIDAITSDGALTVFDERIEVPSGPAARSFEADWNDRVVQLEGVAGQSAMFHFRTQRLTDNGLVGVWSSPKIVAKDKSLNERKPNVILISLDTLRADHLGTYGYSRNTSPNIDQFAEEAILFENCIAPSSWTTPSHATLFTGLPLSVHAAGGLEGFRLRGQFESLADIARKEGYATAAFTDGVAIAGQLGFYQGFEVYSNGAGNYVVSANFRTLESGIADDVFANGLAWIERTHPGPFFLFLHTYEIHAPYGAPEGFDPPFSNAATAADDDEATERKRLVDAYDDGIAYTDHVFGRFMDELRGKGMLDDSIVLLVSDHGEELWERTPPTEKRGLPHGTTLHREVLHVPFILRLPGGVSEAVRIDRPISLSDSFATLIDVAGFEFDGVVDSFSLRSLWDPQAPQSYPRTLITSELIQTVPHWLLIAAESKDWKYIAKTVYSDEESPVYQFPTDSSGASTAFERALVDFLLSRSMQAEQPQTGEERKAYQRAAHEHLYDLTHDIQERSNVFWEHHDEAQNLLKLLGNELELFQTYASEAGVEGIPIAPLTEAEKEQLRALGYLQPD